MPQAGVHDRLVPPITDGPGGETQPGFCDHSA